MYVFKFEPDLVNHLADKLTSPTTDGARQTTLDAHVQARIHAELERLREEEQQVRNQIESELEKENLDKELELAKDGDEKKVTSSQSLKEDLEEVQKKAERFLSRRQMDDMPEVKHAQEALIQCYT